VKHTSAVTTVTPEITRINLYPVFFAAMEADRDWYEHLYILGDDHFSTAGNRMVFQEVVRYLVR
jgi:hypothetical protein